MILFIEPKVLEVLLFIIFQFYFCEQRFNRGYKVQEMSGVSGLVWNVGRPASPGSAYLELGRLVLGYPDSVS